ncbi:MAG: hypothetical protein ACRCZF_26895 [Gemmataceae bacterium]
MRIINLLNSEADDFIASLRTLAADSNWLAAARGRMLLELVEYLLAQGPTPQALGLLLQDKLMLIPAHSSRDVSVHVWVDLPDYGPARDGLPVMHYRLQVHRPGSHLSQDERVSTPAQVERFLWQVFGWGQLN